MLTDQKKLLIKAVPDPVILTGHCDDGIGPLLTYR